MRGDQTKVVTAGFGVRVEMKPSADRVVLHAEDSGRHPGRGEQNLCSVQVVAANQQVHVGSALSAMGENTQHLEANRRHLGRAQG